MAFLTSNVVITLRVIIIIVVVVVVVLITIVSIAIVRGVTTKMMLTRIRLVIVLAGRNVNKNSATCNSTRAIVPIIGVIMAIAIGTMVATETVTTFMTRIAMTTISAIATRTVVTIL